MPPQNSLEIALNAPESGSPKPVLTYAKHILSYLGGGTLISSGFGFTIYLVYCARIGYMPTLSANNYTDLFIALSVAGFAMVMFFTLVPFIPGLLLLTGGGRAHETGPSGLHKWFNGTFLLSTALAGLSGFTFEYVRVRARAGHPASLTFFVSLLIIAAVVSLGSAVLLFLLERRLANQSSSWTDHVGRGAHALGASIAGLGIAFVYGPIVFWMANWAKTELWLQVMFAIFLLELISIGNLAVAGAKDRKARSAAIAIVGTFAVIACACLFTQFSDRLLNQFGLGGIGPVEIVVREQDLSRVPASVRDTLDVRPDATTRPNTFAIRGLYIVLRVGDELRVGVTKNPAEAKTPTNEIVSAWSIPASAVMAWRPISLADLDLPDPASKRKSEQ
jgi:hypothetical protein